MKPSEIRRKHCPGCNDNFYNGCNSYGIEECWNLKSAKLIRVKLVGYMERPPYDHIHSEWKPDCWRKKGIACMKDN